MEDDSGGYCCNVNNAAETQAECSSTTLCTNTITSATPAEAFLSKYDLFYPGVSSAHETKCGAASDYTVTMDKQTQTFTIPANGGYNCDYKFTVPDLTYTVDSNILVYIEVLNNAPVRLYTGNDRSNLTRVIQTDQVASVGAPYQVPVDQGLVVVVNPSSAGGSVQLSYVVSGSKYPWYDYIFLG